jgi:hypothetical protein
MACQSWSSRASVAIAFVLVFSSASPSAIAAPSASNEADALVAQGVELRRERRDREALEAFRSAQAIFPSARTRAQIALAEQALHMWIEAEVDLKAALRAEGDAWLARNRAVLEHAGSVIEAHLAWVVPETDPPVASVRVNGGRATADRAPVRVVAGPVTIDARAEGYEPASMTLTVVAGTTARVALTLTKLPEAAANPAPIVRPRPMPAPDPDLITENELPPSDAPPAGPTVDRTKRTVAYIVGGTGLASVAVGGYLGILAIKFKGDRDAGCDAVCDPEGARAGRNMRSAALASTITVGAGLAAIGVAAYLFVTSKTAAPSTAPRVSLQVDPRAPGAAVTWSW